MYNLHTIIYIYILFTLFLLASLWFGKKLFWYNANSRKTNCKSADMSEICCYACLLENVSELRVEICPKWLQLAPKIICTYIQWDARARAVHVGVGWRARVWPDGKLGQAPPLIRTKHAVQMYTFSVLFSRCSARISAHLYFANIV